MPPSFPLRARRAAAALALAALGAVPVFPAPLDAGPAAFHAPPVAPAPSPHAVTLTAAAAAAPVAAQQARSRTKKSAAGKRTAGKRTARKGTAARRGTTAAGSRRGRSRPAARATRRTRAAAAAPVVAVARWTRPRGSAALAADLHAILGARNDGQWGAMVVSLTRGDTLLARGADQALIPASTLKMYTAAIALERLGPDWRFSTDVLRDGALGGDGTVEGNLVLRGDGDPSLSARYYGRRREGPMNALADRVAAAGVRRVKGDLIADATAFESRTVPEGWLSRYAGAGYAAPFSALSLNENIVVVAIHPDGRVLLEPETTGLRVENTVKVTGGRGQAIRVFSAADGHVVARGTIGRGAPVRRLQLVVNDPPMFAAGALRAALAARGVTVDGQLRLGKTPPNAAKVASLVSPPLADLVAVMNRESINHYAELIFRNAVRGPDRQGEGSAAAGNALLQQWMTQRAGSRPSAVQVTDGSGLSVLDRVTPRSMIELLHYAHKAPWASAFHASLPVAGESELLRRRMIATPAHGNLHAKTGTTNESIGLGGYVTAENGEVLAFSFVFNGHDRWNARATIDAMGATLAAFARE